jgi:hypothetical protein
MVPVLLHGAERLPAAELSFHIEYQYGNCFKM